jgi:hypothetical protein
MKKTNLIISPEINFGYSRKWAIRKGRGRASIPEKMSKNGPVVAEILQFQVFLSLL